MADELSRRDALRAVAAAAIAAGGCEATKSPATATGGQGNAPATSAAVVLPPAPPSVQVPAYSPANTRLLGRTGIKVEPVSLGGEGILRTRGQTEEATAMILEALRLGIRYCDTAPAYASSQDYYGEAFRRAGPGARDQVFLASKTHERTREGALLLLENSLSRLGTNHLDLWQLHDLRTTADLDQIFGKGGAIEAVELAKKDGRIKFVGITGHHDPAILVEAMRRYDFDTVLCAVNPADPARSPFLSTVVPEARKRNMGVIGMKVMGAGQILADRTATPEELIHYGAHHCDTVIIGMRSPAEVRHNLSIARTLRTVTKDELLALENRLVPRADRYSFFKA